MPKIFFTAALLTVSSFLFAQSDSAVVYLQKANEEKAKGRRMEVVRALEKAYKFDKTNKEVVGRLADALHETRMYAQAREKYMELEKLGSPSAATYKQLMTLNFNMRQFSEAIKYAQLLKKADASEKVDYVIGKSYYEQDDLGKGIQYLEAAAKEDPNNSEIPHTLAVAFTNMQNFKQAIPYFQKAIALQPNNGAWIYEMALTYYGMNDEQNALKYMLEAGEKGMMKDNSFLQNLATAYMNAGKFDEGLKIMKEALEKRPSDLGLLETIALACYDARKYEEAINYYNKILAIDEKKADVLYMMGMAYQKKGDEKTGRQLCDRAIAMDPSLSSLKTEKKMPGGF